jgi:hypothetical protein
MVSSFLFFHGWERSTNEIFEVSRQSDPVEVHRLNDVCLVRYRAYILVIGLVSLLGILAQIIFQSVLLSKKPYGHTLSNCTFETFVVFE